MWNFLLSGHSTSLCRYSEKLLCFLVRVRLASAVSLIVDLHMSPLLSAAGRREGVSTLFDQIDASASLRAHKLLLQPIADCASDVRDFYFASIDDSRVICTQK